MHAEPSELSRRERQVMDIVYRRGRVTVAEVLDELPDPPTYSAVRAALRLLEEKDSLKHEMDGKRYVYLPTAPRTHRVGGQARPWDAAAQRWYEAANQHLYRHIKR